MKSLTSVKFIAPSLVILAALIAVVTALAPMDRVLGQATRMVYVHGAIIRVELGLFSLSGLLGLIYVFNKKPALVAWSQILLETSLLLWIPYLISSTLATLLTWGAIAWFEPRWMVTLQISVVAPLAYVVLRVVNKPSVTASLDALLAVTILLLMRNAGLVLHPIDPIAASGNLMIIGSYVCLFGLCALFALQVARGLRVWHLKHTEKIA